MKAGCFPTKDYVIIFYVKMATSEGGEGGLHIFLWDRATKAAFSTLLATCTK